MDAYVTIGIATLPARISRVPSCTGCSGRGTCMPLPMLTTPPGNMSSARQDPESVADRAQACGSSSVHAQ